MFDQYIAVDSSLQGYAATIFAYGQTGSGVSHNIQQLSQLHPPWFPAYFNSPSPRCPLPTPTCDLDQLLLFCSEMCTLPFSSLTCYVVVYIAVSNAR